MIKSKGDSDQDVATRLRGHMPSDGLLPEVLQLDVVGCHGADVSSWASLGIMMRRMVGTRDPSNLNKVIQSFSHVDLPVCVPVFFPSRFPWPPSSEKIHKPSSIEPTSLVVLLPRGFPAVCDAEECQDVSGLASAVVLSLRRLAAVRGFGSVLSKVSALALRKCISCGPGLQTLFQCFSCVCFFLW